jgi:hypothetical protein
MIEYKNESGEVLHCVYRLKDCDNSRCDITHPQKYLQGAVMRMDKNKSFRNHKHITCERNTDKTHEAGVLISGSLRVDFYNEDSKIMGSEILGPGDCTITFGGGHKFFCLADDTVMYEFKNGPYYGVDSDKEFIDE